MRIVGLWMKDLAISGLRFGFSHRTFLTPLFWFDPDQKNAPGKRIEPELQFGLFEYANVAVVT